MEATMGTNSFSAVTPSPDTIDGITAPTSTHDIQTLQRRPSLDSLAAKENLRKLSADVTKEIMPCWMYRLLACSGSCSGSEPRVVKLLIVFAAILHSNCMTIGFWALGVPAVPDCAALQVCGLLMIAIIYVTRWRFLQSGILWSLAKEIDLDGKVLKPFNLQSRTLLLATPLEAFITTTIFIVGFLKDPAGNIDSLSTASRAFCVTGLVLNIPFYSLFHYSLKSIPMLYLATCLMLAEDIHRFHGQVDEIFSEEFEGWRLEGDSKKDLLRRLHHQECTLRLHQVTVNNVVGPGLSCYVCLASAWLVFLVILVFQAQTISTPILLYYVYGFCILIFFCMLVVLLRGAASVGDRWSQVLDELNTPMLCVRTASVLGVPLAERLSQLNSVGIKVFGHLVTSQTVLNVSLSVGSGLLLTLISALMATS